jgi:glycerophosphoryl diester phosphodiesterase
MTFVIAHRGASRVAPENTIEAFARAKELGADWVELDVRRTRDGRLAVHHNARLGDGRALVEVESRDLPPEVPLLEDALEACSPMGVNIEIKSGPAEPDHDPSQAVAEKVAALVVRWRGLEGILVSSFDRDAIDRVKRIEPSVSTGLLALDVSDIQGTVSWLRKEGHDALNPVAPAVDAALVRAARGVGLAVYTWTVDDPDRIAELARLGIDGIITNVPDVARPVVDAIALH